MLEKLRKRIKDFFYTEDELHNEVLDFTSVMIVVVVIVAIYAITYIVIL